MNHISLAGEWLATWTDGQHGRPGDFLEPLCDAARYLHVPIPGSIQHGLVRAGILDDPLEDINSLKARWVEEQFWILRRDFDVPEDAVGLPAYLHFEVLDGVAQIAINGKLAGEHANANRPAVIDITGRLHSGRNEISILLETGLFHVADQVGADYNTATEARLNKRQFLRQPQYQFGWDWNPRMVHLGLHGNIEVVWGQAPWIKQVSVFGCVSEDLGWGRIRVRPVFQIAGDQPVPVLLRLLSWEEECAEAEVILRPGECEAEVALDIPKPELWWPRGHGEQNLYPLYLSVMSNGVKIAHWEGRTGLRRVEIEQSAHPEGGQYFHLKINNRPIFCKGANWVPPELSAYEVGRCKLAQLVGLAEAENMNTLRIWGGGVWANHTLLNLCDERGFLVWHDLLFACSKYPADRPDFLAETEREVAWGMREFSTHPSLAVWCGNNELELGLWEWGYQKSGRTMPDYALFHQVIPALASQIDTTRPYWPSSPYSNSVTPPNDPTTGDQHPWGVSLGRDDIDFWAYRKNVDRFPNEGGVLGCAPVTSLKRFLKGNQLKMRSAAWEHHDNSVEFWHPDAGTSYRMIEYWLGRKAADMDLETYAQASGLLQAEALKEYILNYRRRWPSTGSAIYWMFNDSWPTVHGWGTFDYYLNRKLSFHPVRRAFGDAIVALADEGNMVGIYVVNDTQTSAVFTVKGGTFIPQEKARVDVDLQVEVPAFSSQRVASLPRNSLRIYFAVLTDQNDNILSQNRLLFRPFYFWKMSHPDIKVEKITRDRRTFARYTCDHWVWGAILDPTGEDYLEDDVFDIIPGIPYEIPIREGDTPRPVVLTGNMILK